MGDSADRAISAGRDDHVCTFVQRFLGDLLADIFDSRFKPEALCPAGS